MVLPLALFALIMLSGLLLVFLSTAGMEPTVAANLHDATRARYLAEAGVEWAFDQLVPANPTCWNTVPNCWSTVLAANNGAMATNMVLPGLPVSAGTFSVSVRNDTLAADPQVTGQTMDPGGPTTDTNNVLVLTSTGAYNGVTRQIQVVVSRSALNLPAGLGLPGVGTNTAFSGNSFTISGQDTNVDDTAGTCPALWGIGVADAATESRVESSLSQQQKDNVSGKPQATGPGVGDNTIVPEPTLTPPQIAKFVEAARPYADISLEVTAENRLSYSGLGDTCATNWNAPTCWGTRSNPKIVYVKGSLDPGQAFYALSMSGTSSGAGILIVEDGDVSATGNFRWEGLILVTGQYVGLRYGGGGNQTVYGSIVVNETADLNAQVEVDATGNAKLLYSCQALDNVRNMRRLYRLRSWREL
jgi:hypothetical protein